MHRQTHWDTVYQTKPSDTVSWFEPAPTRSMTLLTAAGLSATSDVIDVGGGDSLLVGSLLAYSVGHVTVLDISSAALARAQPRLGERSSEVTWIAADITTVELPPAAYDFWHDRAVFHFLTDAEDRARYVTAAARAVRSGGALYARGTGRDVRGRLHHGARVRRLASDAKRRGAAVLVRDPATALTLRHAQGVMRKRTP
jgi:SAM-dependent methyltransferase